MARLDHRLPERICSERTKNSEQGIALHVGLLSVPSVASR